MNPDDDSPFVSLPLTGIPLADFWAQWARHVRAGLPATRGWADYIAKFCGLSRAPENATNGWVIDKDRILVRASTEDLRRRGAGRVRDRAPLRARPRRP